MFTEKALTEANTSKTYEGGGYKIHYHEAGMGESVIFLHAYGPGTNAWINFHKNIGPLSQHFRCILLDLEGYGRTVAPEKPGEDGYQHTVSARTALTLMDALGIEKASVVGISHGGLSALALGFTYPDRVNKIVAGSCHHSASQSFGGDPYMFANRPSEGNRATREVNANPTWDNFRRYLRVHLDNEALVTDELVDYVYNNYKAHPRWGGESVVRAQQSGVNAPDRQGGAPHSYLPDLPKIKAPTLIIYGRYDRMCSYELGITILNYVPNSRLLVFNNCGHWPPFEKPDEYNAYVSTFLAQG